MAIDNTLLSDLMTNFDTCAVGENYRPVDIAAAHLSRALLMLGSQVDRDAAIAVLTTSAKSFVTVARARVAEIVQPAAPVE